MNPNALNSFVVDRSRWLRGEGDLSSRLLRPSDSKMCCLGFLAKACGAEDSQIEGETQPDAVPEFFPESIVRIRVRTVQIGTDVENDCSEELTEDAVQLIDPCIRLMMANDAPGLSERDREYRLKRLFEEIGIAVEFVG